MSKKNRDAGRDAARKVREMQAAQRAKEQRRRALLISGTVLVVIALIVGIAVAVQSSRDETPTDATAPRGVTDTYGVSVGQPDAPVTLTVYEDFQCPICKQYEEWLGDTISQNVDSGALRVIYRPLAFLDRMSSTDYSSRALETAACALDDGGVDVFVALHQLLFENQPAENSAGLTDAELAGLAVRAGADKSAIETCQSDDTYAGWAAAATDQGSKDKVQGTPTFRIGGDDVPITKATDQAAAIQALQDAIGAATPE